MCATNYQCTGLTSVEIPNSVTSIGNSAFSGCTNLTNVNIHNSVTSIGNYAFSGCTGLTSVEIPNSVTSIGNYAFSGCTNLTSVEIPNSVTSFSDYAFYNCTGLTSAVIAAPNIGNSAFSGCTGLTSVEIPNSVTSISNSAFSGCTGLTSVEIPNSVTSISNYAFSGCTGLTSAVIAAQNIDSYAFSGCTGLTSVTLGNSVTSIGKDIFKDSSKLSDIYIDDLLAWCNISGIQNLMQNGTPVKKLFVNGEEVTELNIPDGVTKIDSYAFSGFQNIKRITVPNTVTSINDYAFKDLSQLESISLPFITQLGKLFSNTSFDNSYLANGYYVPNSLTNVTVSGDLSAKALYGCKSISNITLCEGVNSIGDYALNLQASDFISITALSETVPALGNYNWTNSGNNLLIYVPVVALESYRESPNWSDVRSQILSIGSATEYDVNVSELTDKSAVHVAVGDENLLNVVTLKVSGTINSYDLMIMRNQMPNLRSLDLSDATIKANDYEYYQGYHSLDNQLGAYAINPNINDVILPKNLKGELSMTGAQRLKKIIIPKGVTSLADNAFWRCDNLKEVTFEQDSELISIGQSAFPYFLQTLEIPGKCVKIGKNEITTISNLYILDGSEEIIDCSGTTCRNLENLYIGRTIKSAQLGFYYNGFSPNYTTINKVTIGKNVNNSTRIADNKIGKIVELHVPSIDAWCNNNLYTLVGQTGSHLYVDDEEVIDLTIPKTVKNIPESAFKYLPIKSLLMHPNVESIGTSAFQNCTALEEVHIPAMMKSIGDRAFYGCSKLNDVYTYTVEPQAIDQNTFSTYATATLHCPKVSYYDYMYDTQWSQFLKRVAFDEDYDKFFLSKSDLKLDESTGSIGGTPDVEMGAGSGLIVEDIEQDLNEVHVGFDGTTNKGASLIGRVHANKIYLDLSVKADYWYYFCFPFNVDLATIQKSGGYIFRYYDGDQRANGGSGWRDIAAGTTHLNAGQGYIFRTNEAGTLTIVVDKKTVEANDLTVDKLTQLTAHEATSGETAADNKGWNFIGNPYISYYDINELGYTAPMVTWNGTSYEALRPGDDDYTLYPFQAFFVQKPENVDKVGFETSGTTTYIQSQEGGSSKAKASKAKASKAQAMDRNRQLINLTLTDGTATDKTRVVFNDKQLLTYETDCDASKFSLTAGVPQLYSVDAEGIKYSINERPVDNGTVKLGYQAPEDGIYTISATRMDANVALYDAERGTTHDLAKGSYTFNSEAGKFENRFSLIMVGGTTGIDSVDADAAGGIDNTYDLSGRHAKNVKKGVVIKNNKKVVIK